MKEIKRRLRLALVAAVYGVGTAIGADIQYVADNGGGEYSGAGYGISVSVSAPASGAVVKYAESAAGPWRDALTYKDVCDAKPIWFQITATGYTTVTDSRTVTITPRALTADYIGLVLPTEDYVYDGTEKKPDVSFGDGDPSIMTESDFDVAYSDNVNAGTAKATFTGKGNYAGTVEEEFAILKADNEWTTEPTLAGWTYGQTPSEPTSAAKSGTVTVTYGASGTTRPIMPGSYVATFTVAESQNYNAMTKDVPFTITATMINYVAVNGGGKYSGSGYGISVNVSEPASGVTIKYAESETGPWLDELTYKDVCTAKPIWFQITAAGYTTVTDSRTVTITKATYNMNGVRWDYAGGFVYDGNEKTVSVAGTLPAGVFIASYKGNKATFPGTYTAQVVFGYDTTNYNEPTLSDLSWTIKSAEESKLQVIPPVIAPKEYTGSVQVADVPQSPRWRTVFNEGGTAVASYVVVLELTDPVRYRWPDTDGATLYLSFEIIKATIDVSTVGWDYSSPLPYTAYPQEVVLTNLPAGITATYTGNRATDTGTYTAHAMLNYNTDNFVAAEVPDCVWTIKPAVPIGGGNTDTLGGSTINYSGTYDGESHGISVILRDPRPTGARVRYSRSKNGPYTDENPLFTDVCRETVWYLVTADHYEALTNSATVTIDPKPFTAGLVKHKGLKEAVEDGAPKTLPTFVIEDSWPCKVEECDWELVDWTPRAAGGGAAVLCGRNNYTGQVTVEIGNEMTVLFDAVYGSDRESLRVFTTQEPGKPYVFPTEPSYHGHAFLGWFTAKDGGVQVAPGSIVSLSDSDTLYAHWTARTFHVAYELNGGTGVVEAFDAAYGSAFGELPMPKKPGYMFDGWWTTADFQHGTRVAEGDGVPFRDTILHAKWDRRRLWYSDAVFHLESATVYDGYVMDGDDVVAGTIRVKVGKPNRMTATCKVTATVQLAGERQMSIKGTTFDGTLKVMAKDGRELDLRLGVGAFSGTFGKYVLDGARNVFSAKDAVSKVVAAQALKQWQGTYTVAWREKDGWNVLSLVVGTKGRTKVSGSLSDGTRVSANSQLLVGERECAVAVNWTKKASSVACLVWLCEDGTIECANLPGGVPALIANARTGAYLADGVSLRLDAADIAAKVPGLQTDLLPVGLAVRMKGAKFDIDKVGSVKLLRDKTGLDLSKAGTNPSGMKLSYTIKTGVFKGSFMLYTLADGKLKKFRAAVTGVVLGGKGYGTASIKKRGSWPVAIE